ncbi:MAG: hypothetical protein HYX63_06680 [Gammaproteobacteria bacterium]|nr:hypothetical protein [Gammaproteobacteria bacterium]
MSPITRIIGYFAVLSTGKIVLWCYLIWYLSTVAHHFDPSPSLWANSIGISVFIGVALVLSVGNGGHAVSDRWQLFRLFAMPFCVSSFSSLIKGKGFMFIVPPSPNELATSAGLCAGFAVIVLGLKRMRLEANVVSTKIRSSKRLPQKLRDSRQKAEIP